MTQKSFDAIDIPCSTKMNYYNTTDLSKYGMRGRCPTQMYNTTTKLPERIKQSVIDTNPCKLNEGFYSQKINYRDKKHACYALKTEYPRYGYYDMPCLPTTYKKTDYYNLNRVLFHFHGYSK